MMPSKQSISNAAKRLPPLVTTCLLVTAMVQSVFSQESNTVEKLRYDLEMAPAWSSTTKKNISVLGPQLMKALVPIGNLDEPQVRTLIESFYDEQKKIGINDTTLRFQISVLNRFYFNVPTTMMYPFTIDSRSGNIILTGSFNGLGGAFYKSPIHEFDIFAVEYDRRFHNQRFLQ